MSTLRHRLHSSGSATYQTLLSGAFGIVSSLPEDYVVDGTVRLLYDVARGATVAGGLCTSWAPVVGGTAADILVPPDDAPPYTASDATYFGGRPSVRCDVAEWLQSTTPASALAQAQPYSLILLCRQAPNDASYNMLADGATSSTRALVSTYTSNHNYLYAGLGGAVSLILVPDSTQGCLMIVTFDGANTEIRVRYADGTLETDTLSPGTQGIKGLSLFANYVGANPSVGARISMAGIVTELSVDDIARLEVWTRAVMSWT